jgi:hypothetical protein
MLLCCLETDRQQHRRISTRKILDELPYSGLSALVRSTARRGPGTLMGELDEESALLEGELDTLPAGSALLEGELDEM